MTGAPRRNSMIYDPVDGRLPEMTEWGKKMTALGRSSWVNGQTFDWVTDFDSWDRCNHPRLPRLDAAVPLQQRRADSAGPRLRDHQPGDDPRRPYHPPRQPSAASQVRHRLDGREPRPLGGQHPGGRDQQHPSGRRAVQRGHHRRPRAGVEHRADDG
ncbi:MAG: hypothetical protein WDN45_01780 [Caulobacteraceae bacterium]